MENNLGWRIVEVRKELAKKYIDPNRMYYVIAGDAKTQMEPLEKIGFGKPEAAEAK